MKTTKKPFVNIQVSCAMYRTLKKLKKSSGKSVSKIIREVLQKALRVK